MVVESAPGWGWVSVLWCFPGWGSLYLCSGWPNWISSLWRAAQCPVVGLGGVYGFSISLGSPSDFCSVRHIYFCSLIKLAHSAYLHCRQPTTCPWNLCQCFCPLVLPWTADWSLLGRGLRGSFPVSLILPSSLCGLPSAPWSWPLHGGSRVYFFSSPVPPSVLQGLRVLLSSPQAWPLCCRACAPWRCLYAVPLSLSRARPLWNGVSLGSPFLPSGQGHSPWAVYGLRSAAFSIFCPLGPCFAQLSEIPQLPLGPTCEGISQCTGNLPPSRLFPSLGAHYFSIKDKFLLQKY